jgi:hypothetical protein
MNKHLSTLALATSLLTSVSAMADSDSSKKASPGTQVVDAIGKVVGNLFGYNVQFQINNTWYDLIAGVSRHGIITVPEQSISFVYASRDCSGTAYIGLNQLPFSAFAINPANPASDGEVVPTVTLYYPASPFQVLTISSFLFGNNGCRLTNEQLDVGVAATKSLTVVPPLSVQ